MQRKTALEFPGKGFCISTFMPSAAINRLDYEAERLNTHRSGLMRMLILNFLKSQMAEPPEA